MRKIRTLALAVPVLLSAGMAIAAMTAHDWKIYVNARFGFSGCYPADVFRPQGEPENLDGQRFVSDDGAVLLMYGRNNALDQSLREAFQEAVAGTSKDGEAERYARLDGSWFVVSWRSGPRVQYRKTVLRDGRFDTLQIAYDVSRRGLYDSLIGRMAACFHAE